MRRKERKNVMGKKKKTLLVWLMTAVMVLCASCATSDLRVEVKTDGTVSASAEILLQKDVTDRVLLASEVEPSLNEEGQIDEIKKSLSSSEQRKIDGVTYYVLPEEVTCNSYDELENYLTKYVSGSGADVGADHVYFSQYITDEMATADLTMLDMYESFLTQYGFTSAEVQELVRAITIEIDIVFADPVVRCDTEAVCKGNQVTWSITTDKLESYDKGVKVFYAETERMGESKLLNDTKAPVIKGVAKGKYYKSGSVKASDNVGVAAVLLNDEVVENGYRISSVSGKCKLTVYDFAGNVATVSYVSDNTKPTVSGVKNGKTYKKAVTVKFSDKYGIKSAKLNGKAIKSGKKVSKKGSYTLKVADKAGNVTTVKFKIKK